jgi:type IV pilus assembly protein PilV
VNITAIPARSPAQIAGAGGFSLVEVLVALVVLAVGMLGVASLFATSMHAGSGAIARMEAVSLAGDIADRIRANRRAGSAYTGAGANDNCIGPGSVSCTPVQMAANDIYVWRRQLAQAFQGGTANGTVTFADGTPATYTINVRWTEKDGPQTYTMQFQTNN